VGRFGPFIKWNGLFINVPKKYDFEALSSADIEELIEDKKKKESEKVVQNWAQEGIRIEKARWGRHTLLQGKLKIELDKSVDVSAMTLAEAQNLIEKKTPKKAAKKPAAKKSTTKTKK
jgi:DNA topoisomerase-1